MAVKVYRGSKKYEYTTFINKEANDILISYHNQRKQKGEILTKDSWVFCQLNSKKMSNGAITVLIQRSKKNGAINKEAKNLLCHALRRRFATVCKLQDNGNITLIERLMGHSVIALDSAYFQPTTEQLYNEYQKASADLTIDDNERLTLQLIQSQNEKLALEHDKNNSEKMQKEIDNLKISQSQLILALSNVKGEYRASMQDGYFDITLVNPRN